MIFSRSSDDWVSVQPAAVQRALKFVWHVRHGTITIGIGIAAESRGLQRRVHRFIDSLAMRETLCTQRIIK